jgi:polyhydroxybutyrate depolymerase
LCLLVSFAFAGCSERPAIATNAEVGSVDASSSAGKSATAASGGARAAAAAGRAAEQHTQDAAIDDLDSAVPSAAPDAGPDSSIDAAPDSVPNEPSCLAALAGDHYRELEVGGTARRYLLTAPRSKSANLPLVVDLHGLSTHAAFERATSGFAALADGEGFAVAYPEAVDAAWSTGENGCCSVTSSDDVAFIRALVEALRGSDCIDPKRIYAVGISAGGGLAQQLACRAADVFAAVATRDFDLLSEVASNCRPSRPVAVLALRDMLDTAIPYAAGELRPVNGLNRKFSSLGAVGSMERWAMLDQCSGEAQSIGASCRGHAACSGGTEVVSCTRPLGDPADAATAWTFLKRFQLP